MKLLRQLAALGWLLVPSLAVSGYGLMLGFRSAVADDHAKASLGMVLLFGGMTVVPFVMTLLGNFLFPSEQVRLRRSNQIRRSQRLQSAPNVRRLERAVRHLRFVQRNPSFALLFCLISLLIGIALAFGPESWSFHPNMIIRALGIFLTLSYFIAMLAYLWARISGKWAPWIATAVKQGEERLLQAREQTSNSIESMQSPTQADN